MTGVYPIFAGSEPIGTAKITREGLYYRLDCRCALSGDVWYKVLITGDDVYEDLGVCVPFGNEFGVCTKVPAKRLEGKTYRFCAVPRHGTHTKNVVAVTEGSPFDYISKLESAVLMKKEGQFFISFPKDAESLCVLSSTSNTGNVTVKTDPLPGVLSTEIVPPFRSTIL